MTLQEVVARFNTTPFLFAGSGITSLQIKSQAYFDEH